MRQSRYSCDPQTLAGTSDGCGDAKTSLENRGSIRGEVQVKPQARLLPPIGVHALNGPRDQKLFGNGTLSSAEAFSGLIDRKLRIDPFYWVGAASFGLVTWSALARLF